MKTIGIAAAIIAILYVVASFSIIRVRCYTPYKGPGSTLCLYDLMYKKFPPPEDTPQE
jgi:hypothetical protein